MPWNFHYLKTMPFLLSLMQWSAKGTEQGPWNRNHCAVITWCHRSSHSRLPVLTRALKQNTSCIVTTAQLFHHKLVLGTGRLHILNSQTAQGRWLNKTNGWGDVISVTGVCYSEVWPFVVTVHANLRWERASDFRGKNDLYLLQNKGIKEGNVKRERQGIHHCLPKRHILT